MPHDMRAAGFSVRIHSTPILIVTMSGASSARRYSTHIRYPETYHTSAFHNAVLFAFACKCAFSCDLPADIVISPRPSIFHAVPLQRATAK
jgi:hypothetical protein